MTLVKYDHDYVDPCHILSWSHLTMVTMTMTMVGADQSHIVTYEHGHRLVLHLVITSHDESKILTMAFKGHLYSLWGN